MTEENTKTSLKRPVVAIVGRMNVGKSTLFNRLTEQERAIVSSWAGTTRDINTENVLWRGMEFELQDTGGMDVEDDQELESRVIAASERAAKEAALVLFVFDAQVGILPADEKIAAVLRRSGTKVLLVANKADNAVIESELSAQVHRLGLGTPLMVSSRNGRGTGELLDEIFANVEVTTSSLEMAKEKRITVAIVGRPNVGKSSLLNAILGDDRVIVADVEHTTRDTNDIPYEYNDKQYMLIDTAGIRRRKNVGNAWGDGRLSVIEKQSVSASISAMQRADVVVLVIEAQKRVTAQDKKIADLANRFGKGLIVVVNKWDLIPDKTPTTINEFHDYFDSALPYLSWAPMVFVSAVGEVRVREMLDVVAQVAENFQRTLTNEELLPIYDHAYHIYHPKKTRMRKNRTRDAMLKSFTQVKAEPPHFYLKARHPKDVPKALPDIIERKLREDFDFAGVRIIIETGI